MALLIFHLGNQWDWAGTFRLYVQKKSPITHCTRNRVSLRAGLDRYKEYKISCPHRVRPSSPYKITIPTILPRPLQPNVRHTQIWMFNTTNLKISAFKAGSQANSIYTPSPFVIPYDPKSNIGI